MVAHSSIDKLLKAARLESGFLKLDPFVNRFKSVPGTPFQNKSTVSRWESGASEPERTVVEWYVSNSPAQSRELRKYLVRSSQQFDHVNMRSTIDVNGGSTSVRDTSYHDVDLDYPLYYAVCTTQTALDNVRSLCEGLFASVRGDEGGSILESLGTEFPYHPLDGGEVGQQTVGTLRRLGADQLSDVLGPLSVEVANQIHLFRMEFAEGCRKARVVSDAVYYESNSGVKTWKVLANYSAGSFEVLLRGSGITRSNVRCATFLPAAATIVDSSEDHSEVVVRVMTERPFGSGHGFVVLWNRSS